MSYKLKTLIVFDTNSLRIADNGEVAYSLFSFGKAYDIINAFVELNRLEEDITLAVSSLVIDEIRFQMERSYKGDIKRLKETKQRMNGLPHVSSELIGIPDESFDCSEFIELKSREYLLRNSHVRLLSYNEDQSSQILKSLIIRAHHTNPPFFKTAKNSDAGFKDSVIWETLLNYNETENFHKVILVTKDEGFKGCEVEFKTKWNKHFKIISTPEAVITELSLDFKNYIEERVIHDFAQTEYFRDYLYDELKIKSVILIEGNEYAIENFAIVDPCKYVNRLLPNDEDAENILITSEIKIFYTATRVKKELSIKAITTLWDDDSKEIISTEYDFELR